MLVQVWNGCVVFTNLESHRARVCCSCSNIHCIFSVGLFILFTSPPLFLLGKDKWSGHVLFSMHLFESFYSWSFLLLVFFYSTPPPKYPFVFDSFAEATCSGAFIAGMKVCDVFIRAPRSFHVYLLCLEILWARSYELRIITFCHVLLSRFAGAATVGHHSPGWEGP